MTHAPDVQGKHGASLPKASAWGGVSRAMLVIAAWAAGTGVLTLGFGGVSLSIGASALGVALMTWLYTGLFIIAHDAIHGVVWPGNRPANDLIGRFCLAVFAAFPWKPMVREHRQHHRAPASATDPDFHDGQHPGFFRWYLRFVWHYVRWPQIVMMALVFNVLSHVVGVPEWRLLTFWVAPSLLSTLQLFFFGTYLPHRRPDGGWSDDHRSSTSELPSLLSLMTCFHFGLHWEHHQWPHVPWWQLPRARMIRRGLPVGATLRQRPPSDPIEVGEHV